MVSRYVPDMGDLIWVDFDPTKGSEQAGHRPAVVLSPFMYNNKTGMCLCVPYTTQSKGYPFEVVLSGQERDGVALADQVKSIAWRARGATKKGTVAPEELQLIKAKINVLTDRFAILQAHAIFSRNCKRLNNAGTGIFQLTLQVVIAMHDEKDTQQ